MDFIGNLLFVLSLLFVTRICSGFGSNITSLVFGSIKDGVVAAFGDYNSDELTDIFLIRNNSYSLQILLGSDTEPLLRKGYSCSFPHKIISVIPGDFDGDALMDVLLTMKTKNSRDDFFAISIIWGSTTSLNCENYSDSIIQMYGEPLAIDYNRDMIIDLFGLSVDNINQGYYWIFQKDRKPPQPIPEVYPGHKSFRDSESSLTVPHSHAYLDLNNDFTADLFLQTKEYFEIWYGRTDEDHGFVFKYKIKMPKGNDHLRIGQTVFVDMELKGVLNQVLPLCLNKDCSNSVICVTDISSESESCHDLKVNFKDPSGKMWGFIVPNNEPYTRTITTRVGDYNMDGYSDLLVTLNLLSDRSKYQTVLLENVPCPICDGPISRTFEVKWNALAPMGNNTIAGAFYDFFQDGVLDVLLIEKNGKDYRPLAFRNTLDYDANFVKVIVLTGLTNNQTTYTPFGKKKQIYGTNLPGPRIVYYTTTQDGDDQNGASAQLPQSAYFALHLPYTIFGLGRTPNFVDSLTVGLGNKSKTWTQLIPNSQMIVIPKPVDSPQYWKAQLFVTPSKLILMSVMALSGTCLFIVLIILGLYIKEKREDKVEKLQEAHRFHFDAM